MLSADVMRKLAQRFLSTRYGKCILNHVIQDYRLYCKVPLRNIERAVLKLAAHGEWPLIKQRP